MDYWMNWKSSTFAIAALIFLGLMMPAGAEDREGRLQALIEEHRVKAISLGDEAFKKKAPHAGTAFNEIGMSSFKCAALAFMFGKDDIFERLGRIEDVPLKETMSELELQGLSIHANEFNNWVIAAQSVLGRSQRDRIEMWNLNCVRQHEIGEEHYLARLAPKATFEVHEDQLHILGDIDAGFYEKFRTFLANNSQVKLIVLGSGGGSVRDAILSGSLIRTRRLNTTVNTDCYSACPLIFLGGVERQIWSPYPRLGFHQISSEGNAVPADDKVYDLVRKYADSMGANSSSLLKLMLSSKPEEMNYPLVWELCEPGITTWVQRGC